MSEPNDIRIRPTNEADEQWVAAFTAEHWGADFVVAHGVTYQPQRLPGFVAHAGSEVVGLATYEIQQHACELVTINAVAENRGVGTALLAAVVDAAKQARCTRVWLTTTNDNVRAIAFYQRRGFRIVSVHVDAVSFARRLKPSIPFVGSNGIPIRDEIVLQLALDERHSLLERAPAVR